MSIYMSRLFPRANSSYFLCRGKALRSEVLRLREEMFLVDAGLGTPRICMQDELIGVPIHQATRFENKVGFQDVVASESLIKKHILERSFIDLVAGETQIKERAAARLNDLVGPVDVVAGEPHILLPRRFRKNRAWMELNKVWQMKTSLRGFITEKVRGGYLVGIAGFIAFLPSRLRRSNLNDRFTIESFDPKKTAKIEVGARAFTSKQKSWGSLRKGIKSFLQTEEDMGNHSVVSNHTTHKMSVIAGNKPNTGSCIGNGFGWLSPKQKPAVEGGLSGPFSASM